ncbi:probable helicase senataxin isoform X2 [Myxocyprinus asiaticus]|uniref:probable helicase senataxin isoform X2 n=1 Tax=Myxocyprinus asiaticus TaxID=70543 RepID=UPI0022215B2F|nr:probable helicase senataxin isoform X2 [Myxocyprinus asiaticus]
MVRWGMGTGGWSTPDGTNPGSGPWSANWCPLAWSIVMFIATSVLMMEKCLWCTTSLETEGDAAIVNLLHRYSSGQLSEREMDALNEDLSCCLECVVEYHRARDKVPELHKRLWEMEKARLLRVLGSMLDQELEEDDLFIIEDDCEQPVSKISPTEFQNSLRFPLFEVLKYPYLLCYRELGDMVVKALCTLQDMKQSLNVFDKYQGTYLLLVHPNEKVRRWAIDAAKTMRSVDRDAYYDLQEIFSCMFYVIELGVSLDFPDLDPGSYAGGTVPRLPSHLYDSHNKKNYWLGICMLLTQLSAEAMDSLFMGQFNIPLCIINTMEGLKKEDDPASDPFWPALHCFMVILDRLGSKIWGQIDPNMAFQTVTGAASYVAEIRNIQQKTMGRMVKVEPEYEDNVVTCSQMVYDCYALEKPSQASGSSSSSGICNYVVYEDMQSLVSVLDSEMGQSMRVYGSTFLWFIPFVRSIIELPELNASYISEVLHYLCDKIRDNRHMLIGPTNVYDKVTEFFTRILIQIIELHVSKGRMGILSRCAPKWVEVIVMCTLLSDEPWNVVPQDRMGGIHRVSSTSKSLAVVGQLPASESGIGAIILGCMMLIRQLLKEKLRSGSDPCSTRFLNLLNKQLRGVPNKRWNLTSSESSELQQCLIRVVRSMPERSASPPSIVPVPSTHLVSPNAVISKNSVPTLHQQHVDQKVGPSRAGDASAFIKEEPLDDYENCISNEDYLSGLQDMIKAKKEPPNPALISEINPCVEFVHVKLDLEKLQEIKTRLNDNQNLSKIEAIAKRKLCEPEVRQCRVNSGQEELGHLSESSCPVNLQPVTSIKEECRFRAEVDHGNDDDDDEPLDITWKRLKKSHKLESSDSEVYGIDVQSNTRTTGTSKENLESSTIIISDDDYDEVSENDERPTKEIQGSLDKLCPVKNRPLEDPVLPESPVRDYDDLSESQLFEFETQQYVASAWDDLNVDATVLTMKPKLDQTLRLEPAPNDSSPSWSTETELIPDEDIERACRQSEDKIRQQLQPQEPAVSCALSSSKVASTAEYLDKFTKPKPPPDTSQKTNPSDKRDILQAKKPLIIETLAQKIRHKPRKRSTFSRYEEDHSGWTNPASSGLPSHSPSSSSISSPYVSTLTSRDTPAIVPPKKVRKAVEPKSTAERLGLKKKERKAFDLSQRSLNCVAKLRCHGQKVQVEPQQKKRRGCRTTKTSPQKRIVKGNKKLLASQDMQFFRQIREKHQRPATVSPTTLAPKPTRSTQPGEMHLLNSVATEEDCDFFPYPQPDPDHQEDNEKAAAKIKTNYTGETNEARGEGVGNGSIESKCFQNCELADVAVNTERGKVAKEEVDDEHMLLTQMEPTDIELCSQMEQFDEENGEGLLLTQRDPVDMDLDPVSESEQPILLAHKPLQTTPTPLSEAIRNDDHLFLKPGMSPLSQKKAKPSTTKIYTPSSRSASLVLEMEKEAKPPPASNVAKAKGARLPSAMAPPKTIPTLPFPQLPQPFPSKQSPRPLSHAPKSVVCSKMSLASEPPSYKIYQRPEAPVHKPVPTMDQSQKFDLSVLTQAILKWEYRMLANYKTFGSPDDLCQLPLKEVPEKFHSYLEYFNTLYPLLLMNVFEEIANEWLKEGRVKLYLKVQGIEYSNRTASASFIAGLTPESEIKQQYPKEDDLVLLWLPENTGAYAHDEPDFHEPQPHFGYVSRSIVSNRDPGTASTLNLTIQTRGNVSSVNSQLVLCEVIGSLISTLREFRALCLLRNGPMLRPVLAPHVAYFTDTRNSPLNLDTPEYNDDQARGIACGLAMIKRPQKTPNFLVIHGPPGTGKSKTIGGLLFKLLSSGGKAVAPVGNLPAKARRTRVLLCAPSNAAIDSLMKKVIVIFKDKCCDLNNPQGNCGDINLVRLGSERTISRSLKPFSLDHQTKARAQRAQQTVEADVQRQKEQLDQRIENLSQRCAKTKKDSADFKTFKESKLQLLNERERLSRQIKECRGKRHETQALVLQNAHVICCTLSTSGSIVLENAFRRLGHEPFSCVIIDEASQAKETETLIPMLYRCPAVILVGDPNQLPPTVVSQKAKEFGYGQSLMARLCKNLHPSIPQHSPILSLSVQYRMHPDICEFPSKYIYSNALKNDRETAQKRCSFSWPFKPYRVFDVTDGQENKERDSFINPKEVTLVILLLKLICEKQSVRVGVITPYNAQKQRILDDIRESGIEKNKLLQVEVDTVDGFQGREMDCIIVSCVRASSEMGSIGFVGNRQRMNVTITRAKFSLFILGHLRTLREQSDWGALIEDARRRGNIIKTVERDFRSDARKILKPDQSLSHSPVGKPSTVTSHAPMETVPAPTSHNRHNVDYHLSGSSTLGSGQSRPQMPRLIPLDCPRDPRMTERPTDPRFGRRSAIGEQRPDRERRGLVSHHPTRRPTLHNRDSRNTAHSSRYSSKRHRR